MHALDTSRTWRRDSKVLHGFGYAMQDHRCEYCGLSVEQIEEERLGCIAALQPKKPQPPKQKRRDGRWKRR